VGLKVTRILQLLPGASIGVEHCAETLNTGLSVVAVPIVTIAAPFLPEFFTVAFFDLLVAPSLVDLPNFNSFGTVRLPAPGVGVAVGVAVALAVDVGVDVAVAVGVTDAVAVADAVGDGSLFGG